MRTNKDASYDRNRVYYISEMLESIGCSVYLGENCVKILIPSSVSKRGIDTEEVIKYSTYSSLNRFKQFSNRLSTIWKTLQ